MPLNTRVVDVKPQNFFIGNTKAVFQPSTVTYNDPTVTYSSATTFYGGADNKQDSAPQNTTVKDIKPDNIFIINL